MQLDKVPELANGFNAIGFSQVVDSVISHIDAWVGWSVSASVRGKMQFASRP